MTKPLWCLLVAVLLPYGLAWTGGYFRMKQFGKIDNKNPRAQQAALQGVGARAIAAQQNAWEALPVFTAAVLVAHLAGADAAKSALAAQLFLFGRIAHAITYLADLDLLRSLSFAVAFGSCIWLFVLAGQA